MNAQTLKVAREFLENLGVDNLEGHSYALADIIEKRAYGRMQELRAEAAKQEPKTKRKATKKEEPDDSEGR